MHTMSNDLARAYAAMTPVQRSGTSAAIAICGHEPEAGKGAFTALTIHSRRLGFAVIEPTDTVGPPGAFPLLGVLASLVESRPQRRPLLIGITNVDSGDAATVGALRFVTDRLAQQPVVWIVQDSIAPDRQRVPPRIYSGTPRSVLRELAGDPSDDGVHAVRSSLTPAERRVARLICAGLTNAAAARTLGVSVSTVGSHVRAVFHKLQVQSRVQLVNAMSVSN